MTWYSTNGVSRLSTLGNGQNLVQPFRRSNGFQDPSPALPRRHLHEDEETYCDNFSDRGFYVKNILICMFSKATQNFKSVCAKLFLLIDLGKSQMGEV